MRVGSNFNPKAHNPKFGFTDWFLHQKSLSYVYWTIPELLRIARSKNIVSWPVPGEGRSGFHLRADPTSLPTQGNIREIQQNLEFREWKSLRLEYLRADSSQAASDSFSIHITITFNVKMITQNSISHCGLLRWSFGHHDKTKMFSTLHVLVSLP